MAQLVVNIQSDNSGRARTTRYSPNAAIPLTACENCNLNAAPDGFVPGSSVI